MSILALIAFAIVFVVPYVFIKHLGWGVLRRSVAPESAVGLTFDDGPDPLHTPRVLDILAQHGVRATFFVKGDAADAHPQLVRQLVAQGHEVGSHSYRHRQAQLQRWPLAGFLDTRRGVRRLEALIGARTRFFRPPFGSYSWSVFSAIRLLGLQAVHWTVEAHDWHPRYAPADVVDRVLALTRAGDIIVMHDGGRGGPKTIHALDEILTGLATRGLRPLPLSRLQLRTGLGREATT
jgi:peptidoglycan/xylan/chitin deacetylase (PgdA/CDA1 family)